MTESYFHLYSLTHLPHIYRGVEMNVHVRYGTSCTYFNNKLTYIYNIS
jgi:hypothetical protein